MRVLLFTGKGGVGKTTLAAASAVRLAGQGTSVLLCSTDPAHSLGDALDHPLLGVPLPVAPGLDAVQLDTGALLSERWAGVREVLADVGDAVGGHPAGLDLGGLQAEEVTALPGLEELLALVEVQAMAASGRWDVVVVDCGPTAETLRMLSLPATAAAYLRRAWPRHRRVVHAALGRPGAGLLRAAATLDAVEAELLALQELLSDPTRTTVRLVLTPERVVLAETRRTVTALALHGVAVDGVVVNRVLPQPRTGTRSSDPAWVWLRTRAAEQAAVLAAAGTLVAGAGDPVALGHRSQEPVGLTALAELAAELYDGRPVVPDAPGTSTPAVAHESGSGLESVYAWRLELPGVAQAQVELARLEDELLVSVGGQHRRYTLPPVLTRCVVLDAEVGDDEVTVRLRPDPVAWSR